MEGRTIGDKDHKNMSTQKDCWSYSNKENEKKTQEIAVREWNT